MEAVVSVRGPPGSEIEKCPSEGSVGSHLASHPGWLIINSECFHPQSEKNLVSKCPSTAHCEQSLFPVTALFFPPVTATLQLCIP